MAGTVMGGRKAAATNKQRYGADFYRQLGRKGGMISRGGGFAANHELASEAGRKGGKISRRKVAGIPSDFINFEDEQQGWAEKHGLS